MALYDEEDDDQVEHLGGTPGGGLTAGASGSTSLAASSAPSTAQPKKDSGDRQDSFVSWDRLFNANAGNADKTAKRVEGKVTDGVAGVDSAVKTWGENGQEASATGITGQPIVKQKEGTKTETPQSIAINKGRRAMGLPPLPPIFNEVPGEYYTEGEATYGGPTDPSQVEGYGEVQTAVAGLNNDLNVVKNRRTGNIMSLLDQNTPGGNSILDNALVNRSGGDRFDALYKQYMDHGTKSMEEAGGNIGQQIQAGQDEVTRRNTQAEVDAAQKNKPPPSVPEPEPEPESDNQGVGIQTPGTMPDPPRRKPKKDTLFSVFDDWGNW